MVKEMNKRDIVTLMTDHMMDLNMQAAAMAGLDGETYKKQLQSMYPQIYSVNDSVFDLLQSKGFIQNVE